MGDICMSMFMGSMDVQLCMWLYVYACCMGCIRVSSLFSRNVG